MAIAILAVIGTVIVAATAFLLLAGKYGQRGIIWTARMDK